jgi:hypothetical protein
VDPVIRYRWPARFRYGQPVAYLVALVPIYIVTSGEPVYRWSFVSLFVLYVASFACTYIVTGVTLTEEGVKLRDAWSKTVFLPWRDIAGVTVELQQWPHEADRDWATLVLTDGRRLRLPGVVTPRESNTRLTRFRMKKLPVDPEFAAKVETIRRRIELGRAAPGGHPIESGGSAESGT